MRKAYAQTPQSPVHFVAEAAPLTIFIIFWVSGYFATTALTHDWNVLRWILVGGFGFVAPMLCLWPLEWVLDKPRREREAKVQVRFLELAEERKRLISERLQFYQSAEWAALRRQVIEEEGRICAECGKKILDDADLTIDHKHPRSRHPHLSLRRENLRVLCRRCNSRKGAKDWLEV